jgi:hypothetical protein
MRAHNFGGGSANKGTHAFCVLANAFCIRELFKIVSAECQTSRL